jgi:aspartate-semialdehyde dehydrogenase
MLKAAIVGATGIVGQQFILALQQHPWFSITALAASRRSAGQKYGEALRDPATGALRWYAGALADKAIFDLPVEDAETLEASRFDVIFTGIDSDVAKILEPQYAKSSPVLSTASAFRYEDDVPVLVPGVNDDHARLIEQQRQQRGWKGICLAESELYDRRARDLSGTAGANFWGRYGGDDVTAGRLWRWPQWWCTQPGHYR